MRRNAGQMEDRGAAAAAPGSATTARGHWREQSLPQSGYRANIHVLWNSEFCVGCFELTYAKMLRQRPQKIFCFFAIFFHAEFSFADLFLVD